MSLSAPRPARTLLLGATIAVQVVCAAFFLWDAAEDYIDLGQRFLDFHLSIESLSVLTLCIAIALEIGQFIGLVRREAHMIKSLTAAGRALHELIDGYFSEWRLTPSERDVATFLIKGSDIAEIARLRGSAEGTVKAHLNAIYRKAGVSGRPALISLLVEDLMSEPLMDRVRRTAPPQEPPASQDRSGNSAHIG